MKEFGPASFRCGEFYILYHESDFTKLTSNLSNLRVRTCWGEFSRKVERGLKLIGRNRL